MPDANMRTSSAVSGRMMLRILMVCLCALCACAIPRGQLPDPPTDEDLRNDGSARQRAELMDQYEVRSAPLNGTAVGKAVRMRRVGYWRKLDPDVQSYVVSDAAAAAHLPARLFWAREAAMWVALGSAGMTLVATVGTAALIAAPLVAMPLLQLGTVNAAWVALGLFVMPPLACVLGLPVPILAGAAAAEFNRRIVQSEDRAVRRFNADLYARILRMGPKPTPRKAPACACQEPTAMPVFTPTVFVLDATGCVDRAALMAALAPSPTRRMLLPTERLLVTVRQGSGRERVMSLTVSNAKGDKILFEKTVVVDPCSEAPRQAAGALGSYLGLSDVIKMPQF